MPSEMRMEATVLHAQFARLDVKLRASSCGLDKPLIHVCNRPADIMIGIDAMRADDAERVGAGLHDDDKGFCGARRPCAPPGGSGALMLFIMSSGNKMLPADRPRSSERRNDGFRGSIPS